MTINRMLVKYIVYKTFGFKYLNQSFCPASAFVSTVTDEALNPQRFINVSVTSKREKEGAS